MKILIVEDERLVAEGLASQLLELDYQDLHFASNYNEIPELLNSNKPDIIFMDIGLKNSKLDGIQIAEKINDSHLIPIIFISAYSDDSTLTRIKNIPFSNYLVKPCSTRQLYVTIKNAIELTQTIPDKLNHDRSECPLFASDNCFYIKSNTSSYIKILVDQILWVKSVRGGIEFHLLNEKTKMLTASMASFIRQFQHPCLIRVHRSYLINKSKVVAIQDKNLIIGNSNFNTTIPVGPNFKNIFNTHFKTLKSD